MQLKQFNEEIRQFNEEIARLKKKDEQEYRVQIQQLEMEKKQMEEQKRQWEAEMDFKRDQLAEQKRQFDTTQAAKKSSGGGGGGSSYQLPQKGDEPKVKPHTGNETGSVNQQSLMETGYGPRTEEGVAELISQGKLIATEKNGQIYVERNPIPSNIYMVGPGAALSTSTSSKKDLTTPSWLLGYK